LNKDIIKLVLNHTRYFIWIKYKC